MEKTSGNRCPRCPGPYVYYDDESDLELGARCEECSLTGFFVNGKLVQVATI